VKLENLTRSILESASYDEPKLSNQF